MHHYERLEKEGLATEENALWHETDMRLGMYCGNLFQKAERSQVFYCGAAVDVEDVGSF
jgi:hypothetical protein